jgi:hypothetical protein
MVRQGLHIGKPNSRARLLAWDCRYLEDEDLKEIGEFTRQNIEKWLENFGGLGWELLYPIRDFHAVCDDIDIPWATEEIKRRYAEAFPNGDLNSPPILPWNPWRSYDRKQRIQREMEERITKRLLKEAERQGREFFRNSDYRVATTAL